MRGARTSLVCAAGCLGVALSAFGASAAFAAPVVDENFKPFVNCPIENKAVQNCIVATTTSGEFKMGSKTISIEQPVVLQGAFSNAGGTQELVGPSNGAPIMVAPPMKVPGGLTGIEGIGPEVTATTELVGPVFINEGHQSSGVGAAVILPLRAKLDDHLLLGSECFVGSAGDPILLQLTTGKTSPPPPNTPITGNPGKGGIVDNIVSLTGVSLVDNSFGAPGASGCGPLPLLVDPLVDIVAGLPSPSGTNTAILNGSVLLTGTKAVKKSHVIKKPKKGKAAKTR
ncbi:MAG TPA: hypothetical protein VGD00_06750 [Solirubrobacteraceae bacterium]